MPGKTNLQKHIGFDNRLDSYKSFFDHDWVKGFNAICELSRIDPVGFDLFIDWKGIGLVYRLPWVLVHSLKDFHTAFTKDNPSFMERLTTQLGNHILSNSNLGAMRKKELMATLHDLRTKVEADMAKLKDPLDPEFVWEQYLGISEMKVSLWSAQKLAYGGIYYAYENFVQRVVGVGKQDEQYRAKRFDDLANDFTEFFGEPETIYCLTSDELDTIRLIRNALTHNGARPSAKLLTKTHGIRTSDGKLDIFPEDVKSLFDFLKIRATRIAELAKDHPDFKLDA